MPVRVGFASALVIFAHPDDAEFMCGGTIAAWSKEGTDVHYCIVTDGSAGSNEPGVTRGGLIPIREAEQRAAAEVLGVRSLTSSVTATASSRSTSTRGGTCRRVVRRGAPR